MKPKSYQRSLTAKLLAGFFLAIAAIVLAFSITQLAFKDMLSKVEELSEPSVKLALLNRVFQEVTTLDQLQRAEAIRNPNLPRSAFLNQSQKTINLIDSLAALDWDSLQTKRLSSMKEILRDRDSLFFSYLKLKSTLVDNRRLSTRIDTLSSIIEKKKIRVDSNLVKTETRTTTSLVRDSSAVPPKKEERTFFGRLFGKKKKTEVPEEEPLKLKVQEELHVIVDTAAIEQQNRALEEVEEIVYALEADRRTQGKRLLAQELELINTNSLLVSQLLGILREVETEELDLMQARNYDAGIVVSDSIKRISYLLLFFFLGAALLVYLVWMDISRSNYYKEELERARDHAEELGQIKERFLANMSHEIRTPLQSIIGFAQHLRSQREPDREAIDAIHSSSEHLLHIVNEVLDYSRISSGNFNLAHENFRLIAVVKEIEAAMKIQAASKKLVLLVDKEDATDHQLNGDAFRLRQILYNLLGNAIKFTSKGYVKLTLRTSVQDDQHVACDFEISDTGIGIRKEDINRIFNHFEQADTSITRTFGGTGLGLTIVKALIDAQHGSLQVESDPGKGSVFKVRLVYRKALINGDVVAEPVEPRLKIAPVTGKVLVVDDDPMILRLCGLILGKHNISHTLFNDPEKLLDARVENGVSHILMDIRMPNINGLDLCDVMRKKHPSSTVFVALTAHVLPQDQQFLIDHGFNFVLSKPFHEEDLLKVMGTNPGREEELFPVIDLEPLRRITMYDEQLFQSVIHQFQEETSTELVLLKNAMDDNMSSAAREIIHKLAGRTGQIGALTLSLQLRDIETRLDRGKQVCDLQNEISKLIQLVQLMLDELTRTTTEKTGS